MFKPEDPIDKPYRNVGGYERKIYDEDATLSAVDGYINRCLMEEKEVPNKYGLASYLNISVRQLDDLIEDNPEFEEKVEYMNTISVDTVFQGAIHNNYNSKISLMYLSNFGITDKTRDFKEIDSQFATNNEQRKIEHQSNENQNTFTQGVYFYPEKKKNMEDTSPEVLVIPNNDVDND
jgi:hypothetical protein